MGYELLPLFRKYCPICIPRVVTKTVLRINSCVTYAQTPRPLTIFYMYNTYIHEWS